MADETVRISVTLDLDLHTDMNVMLAQTALTPALRAELGGGSIQGYVERLIAAGVERDKQRVAEAIAARDQGKEG